MLVSRLYVAVFYVRYMQIGIIFRKLSYKIKLAKRFYDFTF